jgi:hypothetical protein
MPTGTVQFILRALCLSFFVNTATPALAVPLLWGIDEDDGQLFSIADYTAIGIGDPGLVIYGTVQFRDERGRVRGIEQHIEAWTLGPDGRVGYLATNDDVGGTNEPVFLRFDTRLASTTEDNIAEIVARIPVNNWGGRDNITGLSFGPDGMLYGLYRKRNASTIDRLLQINPEDGSFNDLGPLQFGRLAVRDGEDLEFGEGGILFVTDNDDDELYRIQLDFEDVNRGILEMQVAMDEGSRIKMEGLAWDPESGRLLGTDDIGNRFFDVLLAKQSLALWGTIDGLTDVEGIAFVPEPGSGLLLLLGFALLYAARRSPLTQDQGKRP